MPTISNKTLRGPLPEGKNVPPRVTALHFPVMYVLYFICMPHEKKHIKYNKYNIQTLLFSSTF